MKLAAWLLTRYASTVTLTRLQRQIGGELGGRAEAALRFGAPSQHQRTVTPLDARLAVVGIAVVAALLTLLVCYSRLCGWL